MARGLLEQRERPDYEGLSFEERLGLLVDRELTERQAPAPRAEPEAGEAADAGRHRGRRLPPAPGARCLPEVLDLAESHWVGAHHSVVIVGATGVGKTFLACALAHAAVRHGHTALYLRGPRLLDDIAIARATGACRG